MNTDALRQERALLPADPARHVAARRPLILKGSILCQRRPAVNQKRRDAGMMDSKRCGGGSDSSPTSAAEPSSEVSVLDLTLGKCSRRDLPTQTERLVGSLVCPTATLCTDAAGVLGGNLCASKVGRS